MFDFFSAVHTVFTGILLQALPFILFGSLLSSALHIFIPQAVIIKVFPQKYGIGFLTALLAGLFFPVCECASVPLMRGLIKKGVAMPIAVTFMLASPIINPVSIASTFYAFPQQPFIALYRVYFGLLIAFAVGLLLLLYPESSYLKEEFSIHRSGDNQAAQTAPTAGRPLLFSPREKRSLLYIGATQTQQTGNGTPAAAEKLSALLLHTGSELFTAGPFLIIGAFITALIRTAVPQAVFGADSSSAAGSLALMMLFAFLFSACSSSDAFIVRGFLNRFPIGSIVGFLVYGPMMDIKNLFMLLSLFKRRFVIELTLIITAANFIGLSFLTHFFL